MSEEFENEGFEDETEETEETVETGLDQPEVVATSVDDSFFEEQGVAIPEMDLSKVVTLRSTTGESRYVEIDEAMSLREIISKAQLFVSGAVTYWLQGVEIHNDTVVAPGQTVMMVGAVKGG